MESDNEIPFCYNMIVSWGIRYPTTRTIFKSYPPSSFLIHSCCHYTTCVDPLLFFTLISLVLIRILLLPESQIWNA